MNVVSCPHAQFDRGGFSKSDLILFLLSGVLFALAFALLTINWMTAGVLFTYAACCAASAARCDPQIGFLARIVLLQHATTTSNNKNYYVL